ncbi:MAG: DegT/DnrJ/EryC1/StrS family aminotransferase [Armatimonadetes bacterium]|nr:DegT/DnrJ/EryC1/StrS family aminotransferase [Armatimonadota bacterium]
MSERLALHGGEPVRTRPFTSGKKVGKDELKELVDVIDSGELFRWSGTKVGEFEKEFSALMGRRYAVASTSGTSAIHVAVGMVDPAPGDEIITAPITDIGSVIPIIYQTAIPVFADIDPETFNVDPADIEKRISPRTRAIMPVHLFGNPCDMDAIMEIGRRHGIPVIEDCSQAHLSEHNGRYVGTIGDIGTFSFQMSKHLTAGDGGVTITDGEEYGVRGMLFADKGWHRAQFGPRSYTLLGLNYRMNELTGAVLLAQTRRAREIVEARRKNGDLLTQLIQDAPHLRPQKVLPGCKTGYWNYGMVVAPNAPFTADEFAQAMGAEGIGCGAHYIGKPIFLCHDALREKKLFGGSSFPFDHPNARQVHYTEGICPTTEDVLNRMVNLTMSEFFSTDDIEDMAKAIHKVTRGLA